ncbi:MAG: FecR domain-containing protein [Bacteroidota bacterium]
MEYTPEEIQMMIYDKIAGTLPEQDDAFLMRLVEQDRTAAELWNKINDDVAITGGSFHSQQLSEAQDRVWEKVQQDVTGGTDNSTQVAGGNGIIKSRGFIVAKRIAVAAVVLSLIAGAYVTIVRKGTTVSRLPRQESSGRRSIELTLANGQILRLSDSSVNSSIQAGGVQMQNTNKTFSFNDGGKEKSEINSITVPAGMDYKIILADGSNVWLNAETKIDFPFSFTGNTREVTLNGEAYLQVAHDATKPFIVHLHNSSVQVVGTEFNINSYDSGIVIVSLVKGAVKMKSAGGELAIRPGIEGKLEASGNISLGPFDQNEVLSWMQGIHIFHDATMSEIGTLIPRWFGVQVVIDNAKVRNERFSGFIDRNKPVSFFLDNLKSTKAADYYFSGGVLHLK